MRGALCGKLHHPLSQMLFAQQHSSIDSQLFVQNRDCSRYGNPVGILPCRLVWKIKRVWLPAMFWVYDYSFWQISRTWQTYGRTDRQTSHDGIGRACIRRQKSPLWTNILSITVGSKYQHQDGIRKLQDPAFQQCFAVEVSNRFSALSEDERDDWSVFKAELNSVAKTTLGLHQPPKKDWLSRRTLETIE